MGKESLLSQNVREHLSQQEGVRASVNWRLYDLVRSMRERGDIPSSVSDVEALKFAEDCFMEGLAKIQF